MNAKKSTFALGHAAHQRHSRAPAKKRVSHEEKNSQLLHGTRGFCREPALDEMSAKCRDSAAHCAVIAFATARKHEICSRKKKSLA